MTRKKSSPYIANKRRQISNGISNNITDIRASKSEIPLAEKTREGLKDGTDTGRSLPSMLLWDARGLQLFEAVTFLDEYYVTRTEIDILERYAWDMAERIKAHSMLIELGSG
jgi:L-histidine Nalpha-methyltransferase / hercynylcysteine S-oxide synthase